MRYLFYSSLIAALIISLSACGMISRVDSTETCGKLSGATHQYCPDQHKVIGITGPSFKVG
jgi:hypothetical protein